MNYFCSYGGLLHLKMRASLITVGVDGVSIFQGAKSGMTMQLIIKHSLFMVDVHCMTHPTNLVV